MPVSYFERKLAVNEGSKKVGVEMHIGSNLRVKEVENVLDRTGVDFRQETIKYKSEDGSGTVAGRGPNTRRGGLQAHRQRRQPGGEGGAEPRPGREELPGDGEQLGAYLSANLNANTGLEIGADGVEVNVCSA